MGPGVVSKETSDPCLAPEPACTPSKSPPRFFTLPNSTPPEIIEGLLREGQLMAFGGNYGKGKSPFLADLTVRLINGLPLGSKKILPRPVIAFDFETSGAHYRSNLIKISRRLGVSLPKVPEALEIYLEHDDAKSLLTAALHKVLHVSIPDRIKFVEKALERKPNAVVIFDPIELYIRIDTKNQQEVLQLYSSLRGLLAKFPKSALILTFNLRKRDRRTQERPDLLQEPRDWLEDISGSLNLLSRCDVRAGIEEYVEEVRLINGIRRAEDFHPFFIEIQYDEEGEPAGFEMANPDGVIVGTSLSGTQQQNWMKLPQEFRFMDVADKLIPLSTLHRLVKRAKSIGILTEADGVYRKLI